MHTKNSITPFRTYSFTFQLNSELLKKVQLMNLKSIFLIIPTQL